MGIELYTLNDINTDIVLSWFDFNSAIKLKIDRFLAITSLETENYGEKLWKDVEKNTLLEVEHEGTFTIEYIIKNNLTYYEYAENLCFEMHREGHLNFWHEDFFL